MGLTPSVTVRTFSCEKRSTELIGPAVDNNLNACKKIIVAFYWQSVRQIHQDKQQWFFFFSAETQINHKKPNNRTSIFWNFLIINQIQGPITLGDKNFASSVKFQEKFWITNFCPKIFAKRGRKSFMPKMSIKFFDLFKYACQRRSVLPLFFS